MVERFDLKRYFSLALLLFVFSSFAGYIFATENQELAKEKIKEIFSEFKKIKDFSPFFLFIFIFLNNFVKSLFAAILGIAFGLVPFYFITINGFIVGLAVNLKAEEVGLVKTLAYLVPHGLLEIPAILLASSYGLWLGALLVKKLLKKDVSLKNGIKYVFINCIRIVLPILLIAALVEVYLTPILASLL